MLTVSAGDWRRYCDGEVGGGCSAWCCGSSEGVAQVMRLLIESVGIGILREGLRLYFEVVGHLERVRLCVIGCSAALLHNRPLSGPIATFFVV